MQNSTKNIIVDLIVSNQETKSNPSLNNTDKGELLRHLTHVLVNDVTLAKHQEFLNKFKFNPPTTDAETFDNIIEMGLDILPNHAIASLALNNNTLTALYNRIAKNTPKAWKLAVKQECRA